MTGKRAFIKNYGCQMNVYDASKMAAQLQAEGWSIEDQPDGADLIILNSCHIRAKAAEKIYSEIGRLPKAPLLAVAGCVAQAEGEAIFARAPRTDFIFGPQSTQDLPELVEKAKARRSLPASRRPAKPAALGFAAPEKFKAIAPKASVSAFLTIQEGCDKFCAFCVVPYTRGAEFSRPANAVLAEAQSLIAGGAKELILLGQNVNSWHGEAPANGKANATYWSLADLLFALAELPDCPRLRYTTSHPQDLTPALIAAHREIEVLMPHLNLPVQSGSDKILAAMNRRHRAEDYLDKITALKRARPGLALSTDFIVGFPGESEEDFSQTLDLAKKADFAHAYIFRYSPRPGTPAAGLDPVPEEIVSSRMARLQQQMREQSLAFNQQFIGHETEILLERNGKTVGFAAGRSPHGVRTEVALQHWRAGDLVQARIDRATPFGLGGTIEMAAAG